MIDIHPTPTERLALLNQYRILEIIDPANTLRHDRDAESCELGTPIRLAQLFAGIIEIAPQQPQ